MKKIGNFTASWVSYTLGGDVEYYFVGYNEHRYFRMPQKAWDSLSDIE